jgi:Na+/H+-translocating membrane pyrophosphatase
VLTELALLLCSAAACLALAGATARVFLPRPPGPSDVRRLAEAASRASLAFLGRENRLAALATLIAALAVLGTQAAAGAPSVTLATLGAASAVVLGAAGSGAVARIAARVTLRAALRAAATPGSPSGPVLALSTRAGGVLGLSADAASTAGVGLLFAIPFLLEGGPGAGDLGALLDRSVAALPAFSFGAVCTALVYQHCGTTYHAASTIGGAVGAEQRAGVDRDDARNPALVATLVGDQIGLASSRAVDVFVIGSLTNVAAWLVGVAAFKASEAPAWGLLTLPLLARATGAIASAFGLLATRPEGEERTALGLWRGQLVSIVVALGGVAGASVWLLGNAWVALTASAAAGIVGLFLVAHSGRWRSRGTSLPAREVIEASRGGIVLTLARALAEGLATTWVPVLGVTLTLTAAWELGTHSGLVAGGPLGLATALSAAVGLGAYVLAVGLVHPVCRTARGLRAVGLTEPDPAQRRAALDLEAVALEVDTVPQIYFAVLGPSAALFSLLAFPVAYVPPGVASPLPLTFAGLLGAGTVLALAGRALGVATRAARLAMLEVERQLKGFPREGDIAQIPRGFTPTYRLLVDQAGKVAETHVLGRVAAALLVPAALGIGLRLLYSSPGLAVQGLAAFVVVASATGLATALTADATRAVLGAAHGSCQPRGSSPGFEISATGDALADLVGNTAVPASLLVTKGVATAALVIVPLLHGY